MFKGLADFGMKRTPLQAIGFYIVYVLLTLIIVVVLSTAIGLAIGTSNNNVHQLGVTLGAIISGIMCAFVAYLILKRKNLLLHFSSILYIVAAGTVGFAVGGFVAFLLIAYLTTHSPQQS